MGGGGVACSRLRDSGEKGEEKTRAKKRAGASFSPHRPLFSPGSRARIIFAFPLSSRRPLVFAPTLLSESLEQARGGGGVRDYPPPVNSSEFLVHFRH